MVRIFRSAFHFCSLPLCHFTKGQLKVDGAPTQAFWYLVANLEKKSMGGKRLEIGGLNKNVDIPDFFNCVRFRIATKPVLASRSPSDPLGEAIAQHGTHVPFLWKSLILSLPLSFSCIITPICVSFPQPKSKSLDIKTYLMSVFSLLVFITASQL